MRMMTKERLLAIVWGACAIMIMVASAAAWAGCTSETDLSPFDGADRGDALGDDGTAPEGSCSAVECSAACRAAGHPDGACRGPVCQCGSPEGCTVGETTPCYSGPAGTAGVGACTMGTSTCVAASGEFAQWGPCEGEGRPTAEVCNEIDDDCDRFTDEDLGCIPPGEPCTEGDICLEGQRCIEFPSGRQVCDDPEPCSGPGSVGECFEHQACIEFPDRTWNCTDQPRLPMYGCGWVWHYAASDRPECGAWVAAHADLGGFCEDARQPRCMPDGTGTYDCGDWARRTWTGRWLFPGPPPIDRRQEFITAAWGILGPEVLEYCVLAWGIRRAEPWDPATGISGPLTVHPAGRTTFTHRDLRIDSELFDQFEVIDPVVLGAGRTVHVAWDVSAAPLRGTPIPYDYAPLGTNPVECSPPGSIPAGSMTYEQLVEYVQTIEPIYPGEAGDFNVALAFYGPYYRARGEEYVGLVAELHCLAIDGIDHVMHGAVGVYVRP